MLRGGADKGIQVSHNSAQQAVRSDCAVYFQHLQQAGFSIFVTG